MILIADVGYKDSTAKAVGALVERWTSQKIDTLKTVYVDNPDQYISGEFYKRELPCLLALIEHLTVTNIDCIVIDGYVVLDDEGKIGLGGHLYKALQEKIPVIGVAKRSYHQLTQCVISIRRGQSNNPLYITAAGMDLETAAANISCMHGQYRIPDVVRFVDTQTRS